MTRAASSPAAAGGATCEPAPAHPEEASVIADGGADAATAALLALLGEPAPTVVIPERIHGVVIGALLGLDGGARVAWPGAPGGVAARALAALEAHHVGGEVALMFEQGDPARPLILAPIETLAPLPDVAADEASGGRVAFAELTDAEPAPRPSGEKTAEAVRVEALADGERIVLAAERELVLRCGNASITLTRAGKIIIRGAYVSSHATGTHRIRGGTVEIN